MGWEKWELISIRLQAQRKSNWEPGSGGFSEDHKNPLSCRRVLLFLRV